MARPPQPERVAYLTALCKALPYTLVEAVLADPTEHSVASQSFRGAVLQADLVGFTPLCEGLAAQGTAGLTKLGAALDALLTRLLEEAFFPYRGYVVVFGGDSATVVFRGERAEQRAAAAGLAAQELMRGSLRTLLAEDGRDLMLRVGIAGGEVRLPVVGDVTQRVLVCAGSTAHRAVELQERAVPGTVLADLAVVKGLGPDSKVSAAAQDACVIESLGAMPVRVSPKVPLEGRIERETEAKIALLEPFVPPALANRLRTTPSGWRMEGELREAVILFAEIEGLDDDLFGWEMARDLSRSLLRAYRKYGALVAKADLSDRGHRVMALFGLPMPAGNDAERAVLAALEATARLKGYSATRATRMSVRHGIHAGQVYFGAFGSDLRHDVTALGDSVNTAARICRAAGPYEVLASERAMSQLDSEFQTAERDPVRLKGKSEPMPVKVIRSSSPSAAHYVLLRGRRRFLAGRDRELERLSALSEKALKRQSQLVALTGGPGSGKSALLSRVIDDWVARGGIGMVGRCRLSTRGQPLAPILSMFEAYLGLAPGDSDRTRRERLRAGLEPLGLTEEAPELVALLQPVHRPDGAPEAAIDLTDADAREKVLSGILKFLERRPEDSILYALEDLHLADSLTLDLVGRLSVTAPNRPFLFVCTYRPDSAVAGLRRIVSHEVSLADLPGPHAEALVRHELEAAAVAPALLDFLLKRTGGNPGHLVEIIRFLRERGLAPVKAGLAVVPEGGVALLDEVVPQNAATVALARLDGLGEIERRVVRVASAIGSSFPRELLATAGSPEMDPSLLDWAMESLEHRHLVVPERAAGGWSFRDEATRAVAYGTLPEPARAEIHRRIADTLEARSSLDPMRDAPVMALHREKAGQLKAAARWYQHAAYGSLKAGLDEEVQRYVERWERCNLRLPDDERVEGRPAAQMHLLRLVAMGRRKQHAEALRLARQLSSQNVEVLEEREKLLLDFWLGCSLAGLGQADRARARLQHVFSHSPDPSLRCEAALRIGQTYEWAMDLRQAHRWLDEAERLSDGTFYRQTRLALQRQNLRLEPEELGKSRAEYLRLRDASRKHGHFDLAARAANSAAHCALHLCEFEEAEVGFEEALKLDRALGNWMELANELVNLGQAQLWAGHPNPARLTLEKALRYAQEQADSLTVAEATVHLGAAVGLSDDLAEGTAICNSGAQLAVQVGLREAEVAAHLHQLHLALVRKDLEGVRSCLERCRDDSADHRTPLFQHAIAERVAQARQLLSG